MPTPNSHSHPKTQAQSATPTLINAHITQLPNQYPETTLWSVARDPQCLFAAWNLAPSVRRFPGLTLCLFVAMKNQIEALYRLQKNAGARFIPISQPGTSYHVLLCYLPPESTHPPHPANVILHRHVTTPRNTPIRTPPPSPRTITSPPSPTAPSTSPPSASSIPPTTPTPSPYIASAIHPSPSTPPPPSHPIPTPQTPHHTLPPRPRFSPPHPASPPPESPSNSKECTPHNIPTPAQNHPSPQAPALLSSTHKMLAPPSPPVRADTPLTSLFTTPSPDPNIPSPLPHGLSVQPSNFPGYPAATVDGPIAPIHELHGFHPERR